MREIYLDPLLASVKKYLIYHPGTDSAENDRFPDRPIKDCAGSWAATGVLGGLNLLARESENKRVEQYFLYKPEECADDPLKKDVNLIRLLPQTTCAGDKPFVILAGGGAYKWVSTIIESLPAAVHFVNRGYTVFLFTYRSAPTERRSKPWTTWRRRWDMCPGTRGSWASGRIPTPWAGFPPPGT